MRTLEAEDQAIAEDKVKIEEYRRESDKLRKIIHALKTEAVVFQSTKCSACDQVWYSQIMNRLIYVKVMIRI